MDNLLNELDDIIIGNDSAINGWKIFYADNDYSSDNSYHIYLISDDYIPYANIPQTSGGHSLVQGTYDRAAYWDTNAWNGYAGEKAVYAIGGPSLEMLIKSYNQSHSTNYVVQATSVTGYQFSNDGGSNWYDYGSTIGI